jgi:hypothetical protein
VRIHQVGPATPELVWARYEDPHRWSEWAPQIRRVDVEGKHLVVGMTGVVHPILGPTVHFTVTAIDRTTHTWSWRVGRGPVSLLMHHGVMFHPDGCETWLDLRTAVGLVYRPIASRALKALVRPATGP